MEGAAQLVSIVGKLVGEEYRQLRGVGGQVANLQDELATMNAVLRMHSEAEEGAVDHFIREWVKQVTELAYDAEDCVHLYIFRIRCRSRDHFVVWSRRMLETLFPRRRLAREIEALRACAVAISERHARYGVSRPPSSSARVVAPPVATSSADTLHPANDPQRFVGISEQAKFIAEKLKAVSKNDHDMNLQLQVLSIVGFGGLRKTTLAMEVCQQLKEDFPRQAHVSVSQAFDGRKDLNGLLKRVLQQIAKPKEGTTKKQGIEEENPLADIENMDLDALARKLEELLYDVRYLIVIDDVWTIAAWESIQSKLPENNLGSKIIVTTRIVSVARACSHANDDYIYHIKALEYADSKKLFLSRVFGSMNAKCPENLEVTMDRILKKCGGLPLAIISIASLLVNYNFSEGSAMWEKVCGTIGSLMDNNPTLEGMRQILTLSYNHLPYYLKDCMLYLGIFPEEYVLSKTRLLQRWIAEGLVVARRGQTLMEVAEDYFNELANFISLVGGQYEGMSYDTIRRLSIHGGEGGTTTKVSNSLYKKKATVGAGRRNDTEEMKVQHVRSLSIFKPEGHEVLDRLGEFALLRVLDMEDCRGLANRHMKDICRMYLLKFLSLKGTDISMMPPEVGDLENLLTLDVEQTLLDGLPETVTNLVKLETLKFEKKNNEWWVMWKPPRGLSNMRALREVGRVMVQDVGVAQELGELDRMQHIFVYVENNTQKEDVRQQLALSLFRLHYLRWLNLGDMSDNGKTMDYLLDLRSPPHLLQHLRFAGEYTRLPEWVVTLTYLVEFTLYWTRLRDGQLLDVLCKLPKLKSIMFQHEFYHGDQLVVCTKHTFPALKDLMVTSYGQYPQLYQFEKESLIQLEKLSVNFSSWETKKIVGIKHLKSLKSLKEVRLTGNKLNPALRHALNELKEESNSRPESSRFKVTVQYD